MNEKEVKGSLILRAFRDKCPNCGKGHVFKQDTGFFQLPVMNDYCDHCQYHFDREPGYFIGAMYISYGLAVLQGIATFLICHFFFPSLSTAWQATLVILVMLLCGRKNYKLSRILYIHIFPW